MPNEYLKHIEPYLNNIEPLEPIATELAANYCKDDRIKSIVFDIYGTLMISASGDLDKSNVTTKGITTALNEAGFDWENPDFSSDAQKLLQFFNSTISLHHEELRSKGHPYPEVDIIEVWDQVTRKALESDWIKITKDPNLHLLTVVFELLSNAVYPMPNMHQVLDKCFNSKIPIGIVSNAQFYTSLIMNYFINNKIMDDEHVLGFDEDISVYSYKLLRSKPDTQLFEKLASALKSNYNLEPNEVLFVGNDMLKDIWTASQLGFKTALFAADERSLRLRETDERTKNLKADHIITDLTQLFDIVNI